MWVLTRLEAAATGGDVAANKYRVFIRIWRCSAGPRRGDESQISVVEQVQHSEFLQTSGFSRRRKKVTVGDPSVVVLAKHAKRRLRL